MATKPTLAALMAAASLTLAATPALANSTLTSSLDGPSVPSGGDPLAWANFSATIDGDDGRLCYLLQTHDVNNQTIAHIHEGAAGDPGRPVVTLQIGANSCTTVSAALLQNIMNNPSDYYVDVLSQNYPEGAVRGQLAMAN